MTAPLVSRVGGVLSADIAVPDHERELRFYSRVLTTGETPLWREDLMNNHGMPIIGLGKRTSEYADLPQQWMPHVMVADVAHAAARAAELGGKELMHGKDDAGNSQWAVLQDPNGAAFGVIPRVPPEAIVIPEAAAADGAKLGTIAWLDLTVADAAATRDFYREVIGWTFEEVAMADGGTRYADYSMLAGDGGAAAGVCHARGANADLPPVWLLYLPVGDLAESLRRVEAEGGEVIKRMRGDSGEVQYAAVRDPAGVAFALAQG